MQNGEVRIVFTSSGLSMVIASVGPMYDLCGVPVNLVYSVISFNISVAVFPIR